MMTTLLKVRPSGGSVIAIGAGNYTESDDDTVVLTLNDKGMIRECSKTSWKLLGCPSNQLIWKHITLLLPQLVGVQLMYNKRINPRLRFLSRIGYRFEVVCPDGIHVASEIFFNHVETAERNYLRVIVRPVSE